MDEATWSAVEGVKPAAIAALGRPMEDQEVQWKIGRKIYGNTILALCYIDARAARARLDDLCGPYWSVEYSAGPCGGVKATVSILVAGEWIARSDAAANTQIEPVKGGISDAFKRACSAWGIGRDLYKIGDTKIESSDQYPKNIPSNRVVTVAKKGEKTRWAVAPRLQGAKKGHSPDADNKAKARFHAQLKDIGIPYEELKQFCSYKNWPAPFSIPTERRERLLALLESTEGQGEFKRFLVDAKGAPGPNEIF